MSEIPKGSQDNYSKHVKKIDDKGNLKAHPRMMKKKAKPVDPMAAIKAHEKALGGGPGAAPVPIPSAPKEKSGYQKIKEAVGQGIEKVRRKVDYDPEDRTTYKKRW